MTLTKAKLKERDDAIAELKTILHPGMKVYTVLRHVSRSGMSRRLDVYVFDKDGDKVWLTGRCVALGIGTQSRKEWQASAGMRVDGGGMDMGFHTVYTLGRILWPKGDGKTTTFRNSSGKSVIETDGGYLLRHEWL